MADAAAIMDVVEVEIPQDGAQPGHFVVPLPPPYPNPPPVDYFQEFDAAGDEAVADALDDLQISPSQQVREAIPKLKEYYAYTLMVSLVY